MSPEPKDLREAYGQKGAEAVRELAANAEPYQPEETPGQSPWRTHENVNGRPERKVDWAAYFAAGQLDLSSTRGMEADEIRETLPKPVIDGVLRRGSVALLAGASKARKSWLALHLAICARARLPWLGFGVETPFVRYLDFELKQRTSAGRYALARLGVTDDPVEQARIDEGIAIHSMRSLPAEEGTLRGVAEWLKAEGKPGELWFLDCLQPVLEVDANDAVKVRAELRPLLEAAEVSGAALVLVDHYNKNAEARGMARVSGSVAKVAAVDAIITLSPKEGDIIAVDFDLREDPPVEGKTLIRFNSLTHGFDLVDSEDAEEAARKRRREELFELIGTGWPNGNEDRTRKDLAGAWGCVESNVSKKLDPLMAEGMVEEGEKRGRAKTYKLSLATGDSKRQNGVEPPESLSL